MNSMIKMLVVDDEPDVEALFTQRFRKEVRDQQVRSISPSAGNKPCNISERSIRSIWYWC